MQGLTCLHGVLVALCGQTRVHESGQRAAPSLGAAGKGRVKMSLAFQHEVEDELCAEMRNWLDAYVAIGAVSKRDMVCLSLLAGPQQMCELCTRPGSVEGLGT